MGTEPRSDEFHPSPDSHATSPANNPLPAGAARQHKRPSVAGSRRVRTSAQRTGALPRIDTRAGGEAQRPLDAPRPRTQHPQEAGAPGPCGENPPAAQSRTHGGAPQREPRATGNPLGGGENVRTPDDAWDPDATGAPKGVGEQQHYIPLWNDAPAMSPRITRRLFIGGGVALLAAGALFGIPAIRKIMPISVTVNGQPVELSKERTLQAAYEASGIKMEPGNFVDIEGEVIAAGEGKPYVATINGVEAEGGDAAIADGDALAFADGTDIVEESVVEDKTVEPNPVESGNGPIHAVQAPGASGVSTVETGQTSGKEVVLEVLEPSEDRLYVRSYPDTGGEKAIALTFDDGPWEESTAAILDILRDNDAAATFFTVGRLIEGAGADLVKRAYDEGHQVCTHSWDHAAGSGQGVNLSFMSAEEQRAEIEKGYQAIADATGAQASRVIRAPGGNFPLDVWRNVDDLVEADIGWDIDTLDWKRPGAGKIADQLKRATPGDIILMHDGGGDRSQTVEALGKALPYLKEQGFRFITMDEMLKYPRKDG